MWHIGHPLGMRRAYTLDSRLGYVQAAGGDQWLKSRQSLAANVEATSKRGMLHGIPMLGILLCNNREN